MTVKFSERKHRTRQRFLTRFAQMRVGEQAKANGVPFACRIIFRLKGPGLGLRVSLHSLHHGNIEMPSLATLAFPDARRGFRV